MATSPINLPAGFELEGDAQPSSTGSPAVNLPAGFQLEGDSVPASTPHQDISKLSALGYGAASSVPGNNMIAGGIKSLVNGKPYAQNEQEWEDNKQSAWTTQPLSYAGGKVAGTVGQAALLPAEAFGAAGLAAQGAVSGFDESQKAVENGDILPAVASTLTGAAVGGVIGKIGENLPGIVGKVTGIPEEAIAARANPATNSIVKDSPGFLQDMVQSQAQMVKGQATSLEQHVDPVAFGLDPETFNPTPNPEEALKKVNELSDLSNAANREFGFKNAPISGDPTLPEQTYATERTKSAIDAIQDSELKRKFLEDLGIGNVIDENGSHDLTSLAAYGRKFESPNVPKVTKAVVGAGLGAAFGHPILGALLEMAGTSGSEAANTGINKAIGGATGKAADIVASLGRFAKPLMYSIQSGGIQGLSAMHYTLSSNYPEYNEFMNKAGGQK